MFDSEERLEEANSANHDIYRVRFPHKRGCVSVVITEKIVRCVADTIDFLDAREHRVEFLAAFECLASKYRLSDLASRTVFLSQEPPPSQLEQRIRELESEVQVLRSIAACNASGASAAATIQRLQTENSQLRLKHEQEIMCLKEDHERQLVLLSNSFTRQSTHSPMDFH